MAILPTLANDKSTMPDHGRKVRFIDWFTPHRIQEGTVENPWLHRIDKPSARFYNTERLGFTCNHKEILFWEYID